MIDIFEDQDDASTPLTPDEKKDLLPTYIMTRGELNRAEQRNIFKAERWAFARRRNVLDEDFLRDLHRRMFNEVWGWAGKFRLTERNIGIDALQIGPALRMMVGDTKAQIEFKSYSADEIAARFHVRLVAIHPWPNGNGRHDRLATDLLAVQLGRDRFAWGRAVRSHDAERHPQELHRRDPPGGIRSRLPADARFHARRQRGLKASQRLAII